MPPKPKIAVVLFNLGGPDAREAVEPFLFNLFNDPSIIRLPKILRTFLAKRISAKRAPLAIEIYEHLGGKSPLRELTQAQADALEARLGEKWNVKCFVAMRYWHPFTAEVAEQVAAYEPDEIILLPLYPQYSTTTTASSFRVWEEEAAKQRIYAKTHKICCYPTESHFAKAHALLLKEAYENAAANGGVPRILFSAHGLPERVVKDGDPYQWQVEETVAAVLAQWKKLDPNMSLPDYNICYQSRVGRLKWIGPSTESEIARAGVDHVPLVVVPVAFVSEHSETLVELDIEYGKLAKECGVPDYERVPALGTHPQFIEALARICEEARDQPSPSAHNGKRICPSDWRRCACANERR